MAVVVGVDLAWVPGGPSGWCVIEGDRRSAQIVESGVLDERVETLVDRAVSLNAAVVAIDAPLLVSDGREAERALGRWFGRYRAGAFVATGLFLDRHGLTAGPEIGRALLRRGYSLDPHCLSGDRPVALEVYPHALHVSWFRLGERLRYKQKRGRRVGELGAALEDLARRLGDFARDQGIDVGRSGALVIREPTVRGLARKALEDELDGVACGFGAYLAWRDGLLDGEIFGSSPAGYIAVPGLRVDPDFGERFTSGPVPTFPSARALSRARSWRQAQVAAVPARASGRR